MSDTDDQPILIIRLEDILTSLVQDNGSPSGLVTSWIVVCEVLEPADGEMSLLTLADQTHPYWHHRGMLEHAALPSEQDDD